MGENKEREAFFEWEGQNDVTPLQAWLARAALATIKATDAIAPTEEKRKAFETYWSNAVGLYERKALAENAFYAGTRFAPSPAVDALTTGAVGEVKQKQSHVWLEIYGRNLSDLVGAKLYFAHPASEPKALTDRYVQRYNEYSGEGGGVCENDEGEYVKYSDYIALLADRGSEGGDVLQSAADLLSDLGYSKQADVVRNVIADRANAPSSEE